MKNINMKKENKIENIEEINSEKRNELCEKIKVACIDINRQRCDELLKEYTKYEPTHNDDCLYEQSNFKIHITKLKPLASMISTDMLMEPIELLCEMMTGLYRDGYFVYGGKDIVSIADSKDEALSIGYRGYQCYRKFFSEAFDVKYKRLLTRDVNIYSNERNRPEWLNLNEGKTSLDQWILYEDFEELP